VVGGFVCQVCQRSPLSRFHWRQQQQQQPMAADRNKAAGSCWWLLMLLTCCVDQSMTLPLLDGRPTEGHISGELLRWQRLPGEGSLVNLQ
jgi:hypothetical protein